MKVFQKKSVRIVLALVLILISLGFYVASEISKNPFIPEFRLPWKDFADFKSDKTRRVEIAGRVFDIPIIYFDIKPSKKGEHQDDILLEVIWPEMQSIYHLPDREAYKEMFENKKLGWILISPASKKPSLDIQVANRRRGLTEEEVKQREGSLDKFVWYHGRQNPNLTMTVYLEKNENGEIINFISCSTGTPSPNCRHKFVDSKLIYDITYNMKNFLTDWPAQRQRAIDLMRGFEINPQTQVGEN